MSAIRRAIITLAVLCGLVAGATPASADPAAPSDMCADYVFSRTLWHGVVPVAVEVKGRFCTDGSKIREVSGGPQCRNTSVYGNPVEAWCGVYNNGGSFMEPGENLIMNTNHGSWNCYIRGHFNQYGTLTKVWGGC